MENGKKEREKKRNDCYWYDISKDYTLKGDKIINDEKTYLLTNIIPKSVKKDHFNYNKGELVEVDCQFTCVKYESPQINEIAKAMLRKFENIT